MILPLENLCVNLELISIYELGCYSITELVYKLGSKINELATAHNNDIQKLQEITKLLIDEIQHLDDDISVEVVKYLNQMLADGTFSEILNNKLLGAINKKVDDLEIKVTDDINNIKTDVIDNMNTIEINMLQFDDIKGNGTHNDAPGINRVIDIYKGRGVTLKFPSATYFCQQPIKLLGVKIKGDFASPYATDKTLGTLFNFDGGDGFVHDNLEGNLYVTNHIEGISITNADTGIRHLYQVQSTFKNIHMTNINIGIRCGESSAKGALFNLYENVYVRRATNTALVIHGQDYNNANTFTSCEFFGITACQVQITGGYGGINLTFNDCEFGTSNAGVDAQDRPLGRRGVVLINTKNTVFNQCYFENPSASAVLGTNSDATFNNCTYGSHASNNIDGDDAIIIARADASYMKINQGYVASSVASGMAYFTKHENVDKRIFISLPLRMVDNEMPLSKNQNYNVVQGSCIDIIAKTSPQLNFIEESSTSPDHFKIISNNNKLITHHGDDIISSDDKYICEYYPIVDFRNGIVLRNSASVRFKLTIENDALKIEQL